VNAKFKFFLGICLLTFFSSSVSAQVFDYRLVPGDLAASFQAGIKLIEQKQYDAGFQSLDQALGLLWKYQIQDLPAYSAELIRTCRKLKPPASVESTLLNYSVAFAPHSADMAFARASYFFQPDNLSPGMAWDELGKGLDLLAFDLTASLRLRAKVWAAIAKFFEIGLIIMSLVVIIRYYRVLLHWSRHRVPENFKQLLIPAAALIALVPVFASAPLWAVLVWPGILCLAFAKRSLQIIFLCFLMAFSFSGLLNQKARALLIPLTRSPVLSQYHVGMGLADQQDLETLRREAETSTTPGVVLGLAEAEFRVGDLKKAAELLLSLTEDPEASLFAYNQLGCLYAKNGQPADAISAFEKAAQDKQQFAEVYFNLSQAYSAANKYDDSDKAYQKASLVNDVAVKRFVLAKKLAAQTQLLVKMPIPTSLIAKDLKIETEVYSALSSGKYKFLLLIIALAWIIGVGLSNENRVCYYCGRIICPRDLPESRTEGICNPCYNVFISGKTVDPKLKIDQKAMVRNYHNLMGIIGVAFSLVLPGAGLVLEEKIIPGILLLLWPFAFLAMLTLSNQVPASLFPISGLMPAWVLLGIIIYAVMSLISLILYIVLARVEA
jgi:tetratricopeptide (TPR) repeat protein